MRYTTVSGTVQISLSLAKKPNLPSVLRAKPPALRSCTHSQLLAEHLNALHAAGTAFTASEASRKIKLALQKQTRDTSSKSFHLGAQVYYERNDGKLGVDQALLLE